MKKRILQVVVLILMLTAVMTVALEQSSDREIVKNTNIVEIKERGDQ